MIKTRFAPSPTGYLHVGGLRTALYSYCFAKKAGGQLVLRIEDTDQKRSLEGAEESLIQALEWSGLSFDEGPQVGGDLGPYRQSERTEKYRFHIQVLIEAGKAYHCFCSEERLEELRQQQEASKLPTGYDGYCRDLTEDEVRERLEQGMKYVIRLRVPQDELIVFEDMVRGKVKFASQTIDDQVLLKSDGYPTYHLANVVDDHFMEITHVIRGEEWLPSTPKHILLYQAFGWDIPQFAHLPLILNPDRSKLSKRQGDVAVEDYISKGYEAEELINFIAFLGWNPGGTREIYSLAELVADFDLTKVQRAGAVFNLDKLKWFREVWKQRKLKEFAEEKGLNIEVQATKQGGFKLNVLGDNDRYVFAEQLHESVKDFLSDEEERDRHFLLRCLYSVKDKIVQDPEQVESFIGFYFSAPELDPSLFLKEKMGVDPEVARQALELSDQVLRALDSWEEEQLKRLLMEAIAAAELKNGQVLWPLRVALTHVEFSPGAFESAWVLGKEKTLNRIREALEGLQ